MPTKEENAAISAIDKELHGLVGDVVADVTINASRNVYQSTPVKTGWTRENWNVSRTTEDDKVRGFIPARVNRQRKSEDVAKNYRFPRDGRTFVVNPLSHVVRLNAEGGREKPAGFVQRSVAGAVRTTVRKLRRADRRRLSIPRPSGDGS